MSENEEDFFDDKARRSEDKDYELEGFDDIPEDPLDVAEVLDEDQSDDDDRFNLFDQAKVVHTKKSNPVYDNCTLKRCKRSFSSRADFIEHARICPASQENVATVRSVPEVENTGEQKCDQCQEEFILAASLEMRINTCHAKAASKYSYAMSLTRWRAREESSCCSFLQMQIKTNPKVTRNQLLRATNVYLATQNYFRNPAGIFAYLQRKARELGLQNTYFSRPRKQNDVIRSAWEALRASWTPPKQPLPPLVINQAAESLVWQAYQDVNAASDRRHLWHKYRVRAHNLAKDGNCNIEANEIEVALLCLV